MASLKIGVLAQLKHPKGKLQLKRTDKRATEETVA